MSKVRADNYSNRLGTGAPDFPDGLRVTGTAATFSGNVSIAGTLTYQDVESIDSIGIITAQQGVQVLANGLDITGFSTFKTGVSVTGVVTATSFSGSGANLTGVEFGVNNFVASGAIPNGNTVIVKDDGTVGIVTQTTSDTPDIENSVVFEEAAIRYTQTASIGSGKIVVSYEDIGNASRGTAIVGTISGTTVSFGTPTVFETNNVADMAIAYDSGNSRVVCIYRDTGNSNYGTAIVGTVTGTNITFGSSAVFESSEMRYAAATYDSNAGKIVIIYADGGNSYHGTAVVGTVSGTSISFGTPVVFYAGNTSDLAITFDSSNNKVVLFYSNSSDNKGYGIVGTVSGTSISFGSATAFEQGDANYYAATFDSSNNKVVVAYQDGGNSDYGTAAVGTVTGTAVTFGTPVVFEQGNTRSATAAFDTTNNKVVICYYDQGNASYGTVVTGSVSGDTITFITPVVFEEASSDHIAVAYDSTNDKSLVSFRDEGNNDYGTSRVFDTQTAVTNLTTENFIGFAAEDISDGATGKITVPGGINTGQSGLTTAKKFFVNQDGTGISTTASAVSVVAGTAISDTEILVR